MRLAQLLLPTVVLAATVACSHQTAQRMQAPADAAAIAAAIANPARSDADRERDLRDHPQQVLAFAGFTPGMVVADIFGGGGYYSEILSGVVGPRGKVLLVNNPPYDEYAKKDLSTRLADHRLGNVDYRIVPAADLQLGKESLDGALIVMSYHDLYVADPGQGWPALDASRFIDQIVAAIKPGGRLLIVDHAARAGSGKTDAQGLHRIDERFAIADFEAHGLEYAGGSDVLRNPDDDRSKNVFDPSVRHRTDRFVQLYRKR